MLIMADYLIGLNFYSLSFAESGLCCSLVCRKSTLYYSLGYGESGLWQVWVMLQSGLWWVWVIELSCSLGYVTVWDMLQSGKSPVWVLCCLGYVTVCVMFQFGLCPVCVMFQSGMCHSLGCDSLGYGKSGICHSGKRPSTHYTTTTWFLSWRYCEMLSCCHSFIVTIGHGFMGSLCPEAIISWYHVVIVSWYHGAIV